MKREGFLRIVFILMFPVTLISVGCAAPQAVPRYLLESPCLNTWEIPDVLYSSKEKSEKYEEPFPRGALDVGLSEEEGGKYEAARNALKEVPRDRGKALALFTELASKYPDTPFYGPLYQEMADLLKKMVEEDRAWKEPPDVSKLSLYERIDYYIYKLRDEPCYLAKKILWSDTDYPLISWRPRGRWHILERNNAAGKLLEIGAPAVPALVSLLNDRRPIRALPSRIVTTRLTFYDDATGKVLSSWKGYKGLSIEFYRYKDAAREILDAFFSCEDMKGWQKTRGKSEEKKK